MPKPKSTAKPDEAHARKPEASVGHPKCPIGDDEEWDDVDEAVWESFPASDPPSHWAGPDHPPGAPEGDDER